MVESEAPRPASSSLGESKGGAKVRFVWFKITQLLLLIYLLFVACSLLYVRSSRSISQAIKSYLPGILELVLVVLTVVPQAVICALHRQRPPKWLWIDFGLGFVQLCLCVVLLFPGKEAESITAIESALLLAVAVRMYVRQVVHSDIGRSCWTANEDCSGLVSLTARAPCAAACCAAACCASLSSLFHRPQRTLNGTSCTSGARSRA
jgi:hypothetical protein